MKTKLKIELVQHGALLFGRVVEMDEGLRDKDKLAELGGVAIWSCVYPELCRTHLCVRGNEPDCDHDLFYRKFDSPTEATKMARAIVSMVAEINREAQAEDEPEDGVKVWLGEGE